MVEPSVGVRWNRTLSSISQASVFPKDVRSVIIQYYPSSAPLNQIIYQKNKKVIFIIEMCFYMIYDYSGRP